MWKRRSLVISIEQLWANQRQGSKAVLRGRTSFLWLWPFSKRLLRLLILLRLVQRHAGWFDNYCVCFAYRRSGLQTRERSLKPNPKPKPWFRKGRMFVLPISPTHKVLYNKRPSFHSEGLILKIINCIFSHKIMALKEHYTYICNKLW